MSDPIKPKTTGDIVLDFLRLIDNIEWSSTRYLGARGCYDPYDGACPSCRAFESPPSWYKQEPGKHEPDCELAKLRVEANAWLNAEEELREAREREEAYQDTGT